MNIEDRPSDILFRETLENHQSVPPPEIWGEINGALKRRNRRRIGFIIGLPILGLMLLGLVFQLNQSPEYLVQQSPNSTSNASTVMVDKEQKKSKETPVAIENSEQAPNIQNQNLNSKNSAPEIASPAKNQTNAGKDITNETPINDNIAINELKPSALELHGSESRNDLKSRSDFNLALLKPRKIEYDSPEKNSSIRIDEEFDWVSPKPIKESRFIIGINYSPIFTNNQLLSPTDIPMNATIVQDNLLEQKIVDYDLKYNYSHQYGVVAGYSVSSKFDVLLGAQYSNWTGKADLYLENTYEIKSTYTKEVINQETVQEIVKQSNNGSLNTHEDLEKIVINSGGSITGTPFSMPANPNNITTNLPTDRVITKTETTVSYEELSIYEHLKYYDTLQTTFNYSYYEIPLLLRYKIGNGKLKFHITGGFSTLVGSKLKLESVAISQQNRSSNSETGVPSFKQWNGLLGAGIIYSPIKHWSLVFSPQMKINLNQGKSNTGGGINAFGLQGGIEYSF